MSDEFDFEPDFDLEAEFADDISDFDDLIDEAETVTLRTLFCKRTTWSRCCASRVLLPVPRSVAWTRVRLCRRSSLQRQASGPRMVYKKLRTSKKNGWNVVYDGLPLQG
jgi:hypothetical protein